MPPHKRWWENMEKLELAAQNLGQVINFTDRWIITLSMNLVLLYWVLFVWSVAMLSVLYAVFHLCSVSCFIVILSVLEPLNVSTFKSDSFNCSPSIVFPSRGHFAKHWKTLKNRFQLIATFLYISPFVSLASSIFEMFWALLKTRNKV